MPIALPRERAARSARKACSRAGRCMAA